MAIGNHVMMKTLTMDDDVLVVAPSNITRQWLQLVCSLSNTHCTMLMKIIGLDFDDLKKKSQSCDDLQLVDTLSQA